MRFFPVHDSRQTLRLRRALTAQAGGAIHGLLCVIAYWLGVFRESWQFLTALLFIAWAGHMLIVLFIRSGLNRAFRDPSLTIAQISWATAIVMVSIYFFNDLRTVVLMYYVLVVFFGAFALTPRGFVLITAQAAAGYGLVIWLLVQYHPEVINLKLEMVNWLGFAVSMSAFSFVATDLSRLRRKVSLQNRDLREALSTIQELAIRDELTGLYNRRHILEVLEYQKSLSDRGSHSFVLTFADLDHFKKVNDQYGHQAGDSVLKRFSNIVRGAIREVDYLARFGGEEFVIVLVQTNLPTALLVAERIRSQVEKEDFDISRRERVNITVSLGLTQYEPKESVDAVLARADQALYEAKKKGRNRMSVVHPQLNENNLALFKKRS